MAKAMSAGPVKVKEYIMSADYTKELQAMIANVTQHGNPRTQDIKKICSVIFRMNERINQLEEQVVLDDKPAKK